MAASCIAHLDIGVRANELPAAPLLRCVISAVGVGSVAPSGISLRMNNLCTGVPDGTLLLGSLMRLAKGLSCI